jgi:hypothetical protein
MRGRTVWDGYAEAAMAALLEGDSEFHSGDEAQLAHNAAAIADAMVTEKRRRDPQRMQVQLGSKIVQ